MTRVLVIDDDVSIAELVRIVLDESGYDVVTSHGQDIPAGHYDCIVTDLVGVAAYAAEHARDWLQRLDEQFPRVPVIVVTAHAEALADPALSSRRVIMKPFDVDQIIAAVRDTTAR